METAFRASPFHSMCMSCTFALDAMAALGCNGSKIAEQIQNHLTILGLTWSMASGQFPHPRVALCV